MPPESFDILRLSEFGVNPSVRVVFVRWCVVVWGSHLAARLSGELTLFWPPPDTRAELLTQFIMILILCRHSIPCVLNMILAAKQMGRALTNPAELTRFPHL